MQCLLVKEVTLSPVKISWLERAMNAVKAWFKQVDSAIFKQDDPLEEQYDFVEDLRALLNSTDPQPRKWIVTSDGLTIYRDFLMLHIGHKAAVPYEVVAEIDIPDELANLVTAMHTLHEVCRKILEEQPIRFKKDFYLETVPVFPKEHQRLMMLSIQVSAIVEQRYGDLLIALEVLPTPAPAD